MTEVVWSLRARADLRGISDYIEADSARYADLVIERILQVVGRLTQFPESGRVVPELADPTLREIIWKSYRIVYRFAGPGGPVNVVTVFRSERLFPDITR